MKPHVEGNMLTKHKTTDEFNLKVMLLDTQQTERVLRGAWEKGLDIVLALKSKEATFLLFLLSSLFCILSLFIRFALRLIFNGALGAKEMSLLWIHTQGHTWAWERQLKGDKFTQRVWLTVTQEGPSPFVPLVCSEASYPSLFWKTGSQGALRQDGFCTLIICDPFLSFIFLFYGFVCLFLSGEGRVALGLLTTAVLPSTAKKQHKFNTMTDKRFVGQEAHTECVLAKDHRLAP